MVVGSGKPVAGYGDKGVTGAGVTGLHEVKIRVITIQVKAECLIGKCLFNRARVKPDIQVTDKRL